MFARDKFRIVDGKRLVQTIPFPVPMYLLAYNDYAVQLLTFSLGHLRIQLQDRLKTAQ